MPRHSLVVCDHCKTEHKVGESDSSPAVFEILHVIDATGLDYWFDKISCLRDWAQTYVSPYAEKEKSPVTEFLPEGLN